MGGGREGGNKANNTSPVDFLNRPIEKGTSIYAVNQVIAMSVFGDTVKPDYLVIFHLIISSSLAHTHVKVELYLNDSKSV